MQRQQLYLVIARNVWKRDIATGRRRWTKTREKNRRARKKEEERAEKKLRQRVRFFPFIIILRDDTCVTTRLRHEGSRYVYIERVFYSLVVREQVNIRQREPLFFFQLIPARGRCRRCTFQNSQLLILSTCSRAP